MFTSNSKSSSTFPLFSCIADTDGKTLVISSDGVDSINCSISPPCRSIGFVLSHRVMNNDVIKIREGQMGLDSKQCIIHRSYPIMKNLTLLGDNGKPTISVNTSVRYLFEGKDIHNSTLITLRIRNLTFRGIGIVRLAKIYSGSSIAFENCHFEKITTSREIIRIESFPYNLQRGQVYFSHSDFIDNTIQNFFSVISISQGFSTFSNCRFTNNSISRGNGTVSITEGISIFKNSIFARNTALNGAGGAIYASAFSHSSFVESLNCSFKENVAFRGGGAIFNSVKKLSIKQSSFANNSGFENGGAIYLDTSSECEISGSFFIRNQAKFNGGAIHHFEKELRDICSLSMNNVFHGPIDLLSSSVLNVSDSFFIRNQAMKGGAISIHRTKLYVGTTSFRSNVASGLYCSGGAIFSRLSTVFHVSDCFFTKNQVSSYGGAICGSGTKMKIRKTLFKGNIASSKHGNGGGAIYLSPHLTASCTNTIPEPFTSILTISHSSFIENQAKSTGWARGGAIYIFRAKLFINRSLFKDNIASGGDTEGGAIYSMYDRPVTTSSSNCPKENQPKIQGKKFYCYYKMELYVKTSEFINNIASGEQHASGTLQGKGGAVYSETYTLAYTPSDLSILNSSFTGNHAAIRGGAIDNYGTKLVINTSYFVANTARGVRTDKGGAISVLSGSCCVISNCTFLRNEANFYGGPIGYYKSSKKGWGIFLYKAWGIFVNASLFHNNTVHDKSGTGGAFHLLGPPDLFQVQYRKSPMPHIIDVISHSSFYGNQAPFRGGAIVVDSEVESTELLLRNLSFESSISCHNEGYFGGEFIYSASQVTLDYVSFQDINSCHGRNLMIVHNSKPHLNFSFLLKAGVHIKCFPGKIMSSKNETFSRPNNFKFLSVSCSFCPQNFYSTSAGEIDMSRDMMSLYNYSVKTTFGMCSRCPLGGVCDLGKIRAANNFWGYLSGNEVQFVTCPFGYCCFGKQCNNYSSCHTGRTGNLCGKCKKGLTENLFTPDCIAIGINCKHSWIWVLVAAAGIGYFTIFMYLNEIVKVVEILLIPRFMLESVKWKLRVSKLLNSASKVLKQRFSGKNQLHYLTDDVSIQETNSFREGQNQTEMLDQDDIQQENDPSDKESRDIFPGLLKIVIFFYQTNILFKVYSSSKSGGFSHALQEAVFILFNLRADGLFSQHMSWCPLDNLRPVSKLLLKSSTIAYLFILVLLTFISLKIGKLLKIIRPENFALNTSRLLCCSLRFILISYAGVTVASFSLLSCVELGPIGKVLFIDGSVQCYTVWQKLVIFGVSCWVIPFPFAIYVASRLLQKGILSIRALFLCLFFPTAAICYWLYICILCRQEDQRVSKDQRRIDAKHVDALKILEGPFRKTICSHSTSSYKLPWESVLIGKRLLLIFLKTFLTNTFIRLSLMLLCTILFLAHHIYVKPFTSKFLNSVETVFLLMLIVIGLLNMLPAYNYAYPSYSYDSIQGIFRVLKAVETAMNLAFPFTVLFIVTILLCIRGLQLIVWLWRHFVKMIRLCCTRCCNYR